VDSRGFWVGLEDSGEGLTGLTQPNGFWWILVDLSNSGWFWCVLVGFDGSDGVAVGLTGGFWLIIVDSDGF
jgi:hypothetical protein